MKKRVFTIAILICILCFFSACGSQRNSDAKLEESSVMVTAETVVESTEAVEETQSLVLGTLEENYELNDWVSRFNEEHPEYIIEVKVYGSGMLGDADGLNDLRMEMVSGAGWYFIQWRILQQYFYRDADR